MFDSLPAPTPDALHAVMDRFRADPRPDKIDLGVGVFRDDRGHSPIMEAVAAAELALAQAGGTKAYLPLAGDPEFLRLMTGLVLGDREGEEPRIAALQSTGGTGALRLALDLVKLAQPDARVHLGLPSWPSHAALVRVAGLELVTYAYFDESRGGVDWPSVEAAAMSTRAGDVFILHGPCHNPTGADLDRDQRRALLQMLGDRGAVPLIDAAYVGLGDGLEQDLADLREDISLSERALIAFSCSKSFGLYRERTGILFAVTGGGQERERVQGQLEGLSRTLVSMPPAHGAAVVAHILGDEALAANWRTELEAMHRRVAGLRSVLGGFHKQASALARVAEGRGIFTLLPISPAETQRLAAEYAVHLPSSGRINLTGLKAGDAARLASALADLERDGDGAMIDRPRAVLKASV